MKFQNYTGNPYSDEIRQIMNNRNLDFDNNMNEILRESFKNTRKFVWKGVFALLFYFSAFYTLKDGILPVLSQSFPGNRGVSSDGGLTAEERG